jgi:hypothetical protein
MLSVEIAGIVMLVIFGSLSNVKAEDEASATDKAKKTRRLDQMRDRAKRAMVTVINRDAGAKKDEKLSGVELTEQPLFRYDDQPRGFRDGTLWMWTSQGRPVAVGKIEDWRGEQGPMWITCFASLSTVLIDSKWQAGPTWVSKKPGLQFQAVEAFEAPESTESGRLRQFKKLSDRFSISLERNRTDTQELRRLPRHLHRYQLPESQIDDSIMFAWTADGTNPDVVLVIEQRSSGEKKEWMYAMSPVTADKVTLQLDGVVVATKDYTPFTGDDTVRYFFERNSSPID